jgi:protein involved in polysaccharide export with SLBB domain
LLIIALNLVISILLSLTHAAIYDYRLEPGDIIIIIALTHAAIYDYRLEPGDIDIIIALTRRNL